MTNENAPRALLPEGWPRPKGYANGMRGNGTFVLTGGVIGWYAREVIADGFTAQVNQVFANIKAILAEGGAAPEHLVRMTWYVTDMEAYLANLRPVGQAYRAHFGTHYPAMALVQVVRLVEPAAMIEIEATAIIPG